MENRGLDERYKTKKDSTDERINRITGVRAGGSIDEGTDPEIFEDATQENDDLASYTSAPEDEIMLEEEDEEEKEERRVVEKTDENDRMRANDMESMIIDKVLSHIPIRVKSIPEMNEMPSCGKGVETEHLNESKVPIRIKELTPEKDKLVVGGVPKHLSKESSSMSILKKRNSLTNNAEIIMEAEIEGDKQNEVHGKLKCETVEAPTPEIKEDISLEQSQELSQTGVHADFSATSSTCPSEVSKKSKVSLASKLRSKFRNRIVTKKPKKKPPVPKIKSTEAENPEMVGLKVDSRIQMARPLPKPSRRMMSSSDTKFSIQKNLVKKPILYTIASTPQESGTLKANIDSSVKASETSLKRSGSPYRISELFSDVDPKNLRQNAHLRESVSPVGTPCNARSRNVSPKTARNTSQCDIVKTIANENLEESNAKNDELERLKQKCESRIRQIDALKTEVKALKQKQKVSEEMIDKSKVITEKLNAQITRKAMELDSTQVAAEKMSKKCEDLKNDLTNERTKLNVINDKYDKLVQAVALLEEEKRKLKKSNSEKTAELKELSELIIKQNQTFNGDRDERDKMIEDLKSVLMQGQDRCQLLEVENVTLRNKLAKLESYLKESEVNAEEARQQSLTDQMRIKYLYRIISSLGAKMGKDISPSKLDSIAIDTCSEENHLISNILRDFENFVQSRDDEIAKCKATIEEITLSNNEKQKLLDEFYEYADKTNNSVCENDQLKTAVKSHQEHVGETHAPQETPLLTRRSNDLIAALETQRQGMMQLERSMREIEYDRSKNQSHNEYLIAQYEELLLLPSQWMRKN